MVPRALSAVPSNTDTSVFCCLTMRRITATTSRQSQAPLASNETFVMRVVAAELRARARACFHKLRKGARLPASACRYKKSQSGLVRA